MRAMVSRRLRSREMRRADSPRQEWRKTERAERMGGNGIFPPAPRLARHEQRDRDRSRHCCVRGEPDRLRDAKRHPCWNVAAALGAVRVISRRKRRRRRWERRWRLLRRWRPASVWRWSARCLRVPAVPPPARRRRNSPRLRTAAAATMAAAVWAGCDRTHESAIPRLTRLPPVLSFGRCPQQFATARRSRQRSGRSRRRRRSRTGLPRPARIMRCSRPATARPACRISARSARWRAPPGCATPSPC